MPLSTSFVLFILFSHFLLTRLISFEYFNVEGMSLWNIILNNFVLDPLCILPRETVFNTFTLMLYPGILETCSTTCSMKIYFIFA